VTSGHATLKASFSEAEECSELNVGSENEICLQVTKKKTSVAGKHGFEA
jgi:hypothetical protein